MRHNHRDGAIQRQFIEKRRAAAMHLAPSLGPRKARVVPRGRKDGLGEPDKKFLGREVVRIVPIPMSLSRSCAIV
jgi:hypothetical protein